MKIIVTDELSHKSNFDYQGVLVQFSGSDKNYFHNKMNWLPKSSEAFALHKLMLALDSKYRSLVMAEEKDFKLQIVKYDSLIVDLKKEIDNLKGFIKFLGGFNDERKI